MNFNQAMHELLNGKTVYNDHYPEFIYYFENGFLLCRERKKDENDVSTASITDDEVLSEWHVHGKKEQVHDFLWAVYQRTLFKAVRRKKWLENDFKIEWPPYLESPHASAFDKFDCFYRLGADDYLATDWEIAE